LTKERFSEAVADGRIYFGRGGKGVPRYKKYLSEVSTGLTPHTLWKADEVGTTAHAKKHLLNLNLGKNVFDTPKPEELLARIIQIASNKGDLVLDAFLGSGTTSAVAHKLGRRYVGIEIGDEIASQCALRLKSVIAGEQGGVSRSVIWSGGGHFEFLRSA
jgi:adenine-specific DNA-methyltransferase